MYYLGCPYNTMTNRNKPLVAEGQSLQVFLSAACIDTLERVLPPIKVFLIIYNLFNAIALTVIELG